MCASADAISDRISSFIRKVWYAGVKPEESAEIVESLAGGPPVTRLDTIRSITEGNRLFVARYRRVLEASIVGLSAGRIWN